MQHLDDVTSLEASQVLSLLDRAFELKALDSYPKYPIVKVLSLFYEKSTRTSLSFEVAAKNLGCVFFSLCPERSSEAKGEVLIDTLSTLGAMGVDLLILRHPENHIFKTVRTVLPSSMRYINAGSGMHAHPTQALLDMMTIASYHQNFEALKIVLLGDILHSRVAASFSRLAKLLGIGELVFTGPKEWLPETVAYGRITDDVSEALDDADVVMTLRVQKERIDASNQLNLSQYHNDYCLNVDKLRLAKPNVLVMHPGPMNRGVEIESDVADGHHACILEQVENGVFLRMAVLERLIQASA